MSTPRETTGRTLLVAFVLCIVCSVVVAGAAVALKPMQTSNKVLDRKKNILAAAGMLPEGRVGKAEVEAAFERFRVRLVDLETGTYVAEDGSGGPGIDPMRYDPLKAAKDPELSEALSGDADIAGIGRRERYSLVYLLEDGGALQKIVLPVRGYGLWSTLYGFLVLEGDANTVIGLAYYDQKETPGLGGEVDNPSWKAQWTGKQIYGEDGKVAIRLVKGGVIQGSPTAQYEVDAISGATLTGNGVENMLEFWMGERGFGPLLGKIRSGGEA